MIALEWLRNQTEQLSRVPWAFDGLRWILEGGFIAHRRMLDAHRQFLQGNVLDCGCGTGVFASCFAPHQYTGIDISSAYVARARALHPQHKFLVMDASRMAFATHSFDAVAISGVLHHMPDSFAQAVLGEVARILKPNGSLLLWEDVPSRSAWNVVGHSVHQLDVGEHIRPEHEYLKLLAPAFEIKSMRPMRSGFMDYCVIHARRPAKSNGRPIANPSADCEAHAVC